MPAHPPAKLLATLYALVPEDGSTIGNQALRHQLSDAVNGEVAEKAYLAARDALIAEGKLLKGAGRGGSVRRTTIDEAIGAQYDDGSAFSLEAQAVPAELPFARAGKTGTSSRTAARPASTRTCSSSSMGPCRCPSRRESIGRWR